jgi:hypothetical protein
MKGNQKDGENIREEKRRVKERGAGENVRNWRETNGSGLGDGMCSFACYEHRITNNALETGTRVD